MPSPLGHALAGLSIGLLADSRPTGSTDATRPWPWLMPVAAAAVAVSPDLDLVFEHFSIHVHRSASHSISATLLIFIVTMAVTGKVTRRNLKDDGRRTSYEGRWRWATTLALAHLSHIVMDWLGQDPSLPQGLQALWPFSQDFYISGLDLFPSTDRRLRTSPTAWQTNFWALFVEALVMTPIALLAVWWKRRARRATT